MSTRRGVRRPRPAETQAAPPAAGRAAVPGRDAERASAASADRATGAPPAGARVDGRLQAQLRASLGDTSATASAPGAAPDRAPQGRPLASSERTAFETSFGRDFGHVRVHDDSVGAEVARRLDARALTAGSHIYFGRDQYRPGSGHGRRLLAHELAHVAQRDRHPQAAPTDAILSRPSDGSEREATQAAEMALAGRRPSVEARPGAAIQRDAAGAGRGAGIGALAGAATGATIGALFGPLGMGVGAGVGALVGAGIGALAGGLSNPFRTETTPYGTFNVYPDNFTGNLPVANYQTAGWPVRESVFRRIREVIAAISGGTAAIRLGGDNAFKAAVLRDLGWLLTQPVGRELINAINASGKTMTINPTTGGNTTDYNPNADSYERPGGAPGPGANITIEYNTAEWNPYGGTEAWMRRPPAIGLAHEMVHGWTGMIGTRALGETGGERRRELQATGLGEFSGALYTENRFRAAFGLPLRTRY